MTKHRQPMRCGAIGLLLATGVQVGCATPPWLCLTPSGPDTVTLVADLNANDNTAIAVDLVFITDNLAAQQISTLPAQEYFSRRAQFIRDFTTGFQVRSWELAPGQIARDVPVHPTCNRVKTLLFARYATAGDHRQVLRNASAIVVSLNVDDFKVTP